MKPAPPVTRIRLMVDTPGNSPQGSGPVAPGNSEIGWVVAISAVSVVIFLIPAGSMVDRHGRKQFLAAGARVNIRDKWDDTALTWAAQHGHAEACRALIEGGADIDASQYEGATALILAADRGHLDAVKVLVEAGANVNARHGKEDQPVLAFAARGGHREVVDYLKERGAGWR